MPVEISHISPQITPFEPGANEEGMKLALDLIDEVRNKAHAKIVEYQKELPPTTTSWLRDGCSKKGT